jgi:hypothetical protein
LALIAEHLQARIVHFFDEAILGNRDDAIGHSFENGTCPRFALPKSHGNFSQHVLILGLLLARR